ncbi:MFS transporter [Testudinibacter sp. TR-2022]|uniref:MFS transporter n=1 Tax=Testudinibacter sp. TR-2022 TaxID=2585029 RepID=UPI00111B8FB4|nr:MFS transporter [Testudinibacter sp. TR-2022]TNH09374.1 MFS transporter [Pasteurellaceae bacterium Phil11]TNH24142.1 MFS transporter [Testudinibacter sp. TR-2022]TNH29400.1 MFS transporter [Testudinibacter sp. TR-2022]
MFAILKNRTYRHLFLAQIASLLGTGLATVALGLLAFDIAAGNAGQVLGTALAIKMAAYIGIAPLAGALAEKFPRRAMLVALDVVRAAVALLLPFVNQAWQIYVLIFVLQSASAAFTPTFQATIPDILPDEKDYTQALSLSRLAYDLENLASPLLAAALLSVVSFHSLFMGTVAGFLLSAWLVFTVALPTFKPTVQRRFMQRLTRGSRLYLATPRLRGLLAFNLAIAAASAMVIVNTVVMVQGEFALGQRDTAFALMCYGAGSMLTALALPQLLDKLSDRRAMAGGALLLALGLLAGSAINGFYSLLAVWLLLGIGGALSALPTGRLLRRSATEADRPALFSAQFALSHACWLLTYPLAGWLGSRLGMGYTFAIFSAIAGAALAAALTLWREETPLPPHRHNLPADHPHLQQYPLQNGRHRHDGRADEYHDWLR